MKKIITLALVLTTLTFSSFANNTYGINQRALNSFSKSFRNAEDVRWEMKNDLYKVTFKSYGKELYAYYNASGEQVALSRNIHIEQLPLTLSGELKNMYQDSWLSELFEVSANGETAYFATIESPTHITVLKADGTSGWAIYKKEKRK